MYAGVADQQFLIQISSAPPKSKVATGPARLHVQDHKFCLTAGVPPRLLGVWEIAHLRRYGVVDGKFCFEGGSRCGARGEGLHVLGCGQASEVQQALQLASQGRLATRRRPIARKMSGTLIPVVVTSFGPCHWRVKTDVTFLALQNQGTLFGNLLLEILSFSKF